MKTTMAGLAGLIMIASALPVEAQRWRAELRAGAALPTQELADSDLGTGIGFEGAVHVRLHRHLSAYAGWDWVHFTTDDGFVGEMDVEETGYALGLRFDHPFGAEEGSVGWFVRSGATINHIEIEDDDGEIVADTEHGLGWEAGAGVWFDLGRSWRLTPGVRYRALSRDLEFEDVTTPIDLTYVSVSVGLVRIF